MIGHLAHEEIEIGTLGGGNSVGTHAANYAQPANTPSCPVDS